jgi:hypothetical protein
MIREMLGLAEGILQDLHNDHVEIASLISRIEKSDDRAEREALFEEMKTKLLGHAHAEQEVLYRRLEDSESEDSRNFALEGSNEHQIVAFSSGRSGRRNYSQEIFVCFVTIENILNMPKEEVR